MDEGLPRITVGITCFNAEGTILRALNSAESQRWPNKEIIVVDDGSVDNSVATIKERITEVENARLIVHEENRGFPAALNTIIEKASGDFIAIFDDDDESDAARLCCQYRAIRQYEVRHGSKLVACYASGFRYYPNGYRVCLNAIGSQDPVPSGTCVIDYLLFFDKRGQGCFFGSGTPTCALMVRRTVFDYVGRYDVTLRRNEDADFAIRLAMLGGHFIGCKEPVLKQYATTGEDKKPEVAYESHKALIEKYRTYLMSKNLYWYTLYWGRLRYYHFSGQRGRALRALAALFLLYPRRTWAHFTYSAPRRLVHEWKMGRPQGRSYHAK